MTKEAKKPQSQFQEPFEYVVATHNTRTTSAYEQVLQLKGGAKLFGFNPEDRFPEPESTSPIEPTLFKLAMAEEMALLINSPHALLLASDVLFKKDGEVFHRAPEFRNTKRDQNLEFSPRLIDYFVALYSDQPFSSQWLTSYGISKRRKKHDEQKRTVTNPMNLIGEFPPLNPDLIIKNLEPHATPGADLIRIAKKMKIKLAVHPLGSDKKRDITPKQAEWMVVDRAPKSREMIRRIQKQDFMSRTHDFVLQSESDDETLELSLPFRVAFMGGLLDWFLDSKSN